MFALLASRDVVQECLAVFGSAESLARVVGLDFELATTTDIVRERCTVIACVSQVDFLGCSLLELFEISSASVQFCLDLIKSISDNVDTLAGIFWSTAAFQAILEAFQFLKEVLLFFVELLQALGHSCAFAIREMCPLALRGSLRVNGQKTKKPATYE